MPRDHLIFDAGPDPDGDAAEPEARFLRFRRVDVSLERRLQRQLQLLEPEDSGLSASCDDARHSSLLAECAPQPRARPAGIEADLSALFGPAERRRGLRARVQSGALGPGRADPQSPDRNPRLGAGVLAGSARTARTARLGGERPGPRALGRRALRAGEVARLLGPLGASAVLQPSTFLTSTHSAQPYLTKIF